MKILQSLALVLTFSAVNSQRGSWTGSYTGSYTRTTVPTTTETVYSDVSNLILCIYFFEVSYHIVSKFLLLCHVSDIFIKIYFYFKSVCLGCDGIDWCWYLCRSYCQYKLWYGCHWLLWNTWVQWKQSHHLFRCSKSCSGNRCLSRWNTE